MLELIVEMQSRMYLNSVHLQQINSGANNSNLLWTLAFLHNPQHFSPIRLQLLRPHAADALQVF